MRIRLERKYGSQTINPLMLKWKPPPPDGATMIPYNSKEENHVPMMMRIQTLKTIEIGFRHINSSSLVLYWNKMNSYLSRKSYWMHLIFPALISCDLKILSKLYVISCFKIYKFNSCRFYVRNKSTRRNWINISLSNWHMLK